jgi:hypothetical protein
MNQKIEIKERFKTIPFKKGRPERNTIIGADDIMNLRIALNTATSFEEFLALV